MSHRREGATERYVVAGQARWDPTGTGSTISSVEGPLGDVAAVWLFCDPSLEGDAWATALPSIRRRHLFTWSAKLRPPAWQPPGGDDEHTLLWRAGSRAATHQFQGLPYVESRYQVLSNTEHTVRDFIDGLGARSSGFACALGDSGEPDSTWLRSAQLMEAHFSLSRDFANSIELESQRRRIAALYVKFSVEAGLFPIIPLNKHPHSGFVLFCPVEHYPDVLRRMTGDTMALEGDQATKEINTFLEGGGDLSYI